MPTVRRSLTLVLSIVGVAGSKDLPDSSALSLCLPIRHTGAQLPATADNPE
jgi:hypothetical protein